MKDRYSKKALDEAIADWIAKHRNQKPLVPHGGDAVGVTIILVPLTFVFSLRGSREAKIRRFAVGSPTPSGLRSFLISEN